MRRGKTVLVTGALGYIGSVLTQYLGEHGFDCVAYDTGFFKDSYLYPPIEPKIILRDIRQFRRDDLTGVAAVVHLAGISNDPFGNLQPEKIYDPTRVYTLQVARICKELEVRFIFASSCSVYGKGQDRLLTEEAEPSPQTPYSLNKLQIEDDLEAVSDASFSPIILRFATVYGLSPRMRFDLVVNMLIGMAVANGKIILNSDGRAWRPHVHIEDVCQAIQYAIETEVQGSGPVILNVGDTSQNFQVLDVAEMVRRHQPGCQVTFLHKSTAQNQDEVELVRDRKIQDGVDARTYRISFELIKQVLPGFHCRWTLERAIPAMIDALACMGFSEQHLKNISFYRLQKLDFLFQRGYLTDDLYWKSEPGKCN
jgi:nucleoside-diphosphate-sugar epimerase